MEGLADVRAAILKRFAQLFVALLLMSACLFLSARRLDWWNAWVFLGLYVAGIIGTGSILIKKNPELIAERASFKKDAKSWDKVLAPTMAMYVPIAIWIAAGLMRETTGRIAGRSGKKLQV
jgi:hypothetical protein